LKRFFANLYAEGLEKAKGRSDGDQAAKHPVAKMEKAGETLDRPTDSNCESNVRTIE
jgi:hypothetical protein